MGPVAYYFLIVEVIFVNQFFYACSPIINIIIESYVKISREIGYRWYYLTKRSDIIAKGNLEYIALNLFQLIRYLIFIVPGNP